MKINDKVTNFLEEAFGGKRLYQPVFDRAPYALRFEIEDESIEDFNEYYTDLLGKAISIFEKAFSSNDEVIVIYQKETYGKQRISRRSFPFKSISKINDYQLRRYKNLHQDKLKIFKMKGTAAFILTKTKYINYKNIFTAITHLNFTLPEQKIAIKKSKSISQANFTF